MDKKYIISLLLITIVFISACSGGSYTGNVTKEVVSCNEPYFEFMTGKCCLDKNSNQICDADENKVGKTRGGVKVSSMRDMKRTVKNNNIKTKV